MLVIFSSMDIKQDSDMYELCCSSRLSRIDVGPRLPSLQKQPSPRTRATRFRLPCVTFPGHGRWARRHRQRRQANILAKGDIYRGSRQEAFRQSSHTDRRSMLAAERQIQKISQGRSSRQHTEKTARTSGKLSKQQEHYLRIQHWLTSLASYSFAMLQLSNKPSEEMHQRRKNAQVEAS